MTGCWPCLTIWIGAEERGIVKTIRTGNGVVSFDGGSIQTICFWAGSSAPEHTLDKREVGRFKSSPAHQIRLRLRARPRGACFSVQL